MPRNDEFAQSNANFQLLEADGSAALRESIKHGVRKWGTHARHPKNLHQDGSAAAAHLSVNKEQDGGQMHSAKCSIFEQNDNAGEIYCKNLIYEQIEYF